MMNDPNRPKWQRGAGSDFWVVLITVGRVMLVLAVFLILFLSIFIGYFTIPLFLIGAAALLYMLFDVIMYYRAKKRRPELRDQFVQSHSQDGEPED